MRRVRYRAAPAELQVEVVAAKFEAVRPAVDGEIIVELHVLVVAEHKRGGIAHRAVKPSGRDLREADIARAPRHTRQAHLSREVHAAVEARLSSLNFHPAETKLVQPRRADRVRMAHREVPRLGPERPAEP